jgi:hypothetical protein
MDRPVPVFIAEGQILTPRHKELLGRFLDVDEWELSSIPQGGLKKELVDRLLKDSPPPSAVIFVSHEPLLLAKFCRRVHQCVYLFYKLGDGSLELCRV